MYNEEKVMGLITTGHNCSQTVLMYFSDRLGLDIEIAKKISKGFESGMFTSDLCGCVSGGYMVLSMRYSDDIENNRALLKQKTTEFLKKFKNSNKDTVCKNLLGVDISDDKILATAMSDGTIPNTCPNLMISAIKILDEMI